MYNVINRFASLVAGCVLALTGISTVSCDSEAKREKTAAEALTLKADSLIQVGNYESAFVLMDSLDKSFPKQLESRRKVTVMRSKAMSEYSQKQLDATDSLITMLDAQINDLVPLFKHIPATDISGYYTVSKTHKPDFVNTTGLEARMDDDDFSFYIVAVNSSRPIGINQLTLVSDLGSVSSQAIPADNDRSGDLDASGIDMASFISYEVDSLASWALDNAEHVNKAVLTGKKGGTITLNINPIIARSIGLTWRLSDLSLRLQRARLLRDKLEQQLVIARDHTVNLMDQ